MPNEPKPAAEKRSPLAVPRHNAQDDHEGSPHRPEEFDVMNPAKKGMSREQQRVQPENVARHAQAQDTDEPSIPRGRNPDTAMCEDRDHPGRIDKSNDC